MGLGLGLGLGLAIGLGMGFGQAPCYPMELSGDSLRHRRRLADGLSGVRALTLTLRPNPNPPP